MKRRIFLVIAASLLGLYVFMSDYLYGRKHDAQVCVGLDVRVCDSLNYPYVKASELRQLLLINQMLLLDKPSAEIDLSAIEDVVNRHPLVKQSEVYFTPSGRLCVDVWQRVPVLRVMNGKSTFFIDSEGLPMRFDARHAVFSIDVPVVTGHVAETDSASLAQLFDFSKRLKKDKFIDALVEQIHVGDDGLWTLYPRVGNFDIVLGLPERLDFKLAAIRSFYEEALPKVGWNRYQSISLEFDNQIVCTKKIKK